MMLGWNTFQRRFGEHGKPSPESVLGYRHLSDADSRDSPLEAKVRELIALAVAVARQSDDCIAMHMDAAVKLGATQEEIAEALGVAMAVNAAATRP
jgi:AhpD family alkylhydroperoxidase